WRARPERYAELVVEAPPLGRDDLPKRAEPTALEKAGVHVFGRAIDYFTEANWHRLWERKPFKLTVWVTIAVLIASGFEVLPTFLIRSNVPSIASVKPYTPLELMGRDVYIAEGCYNCHSQMVRPLRAETERYGEYSKPGEFVYDHPFQWGSRRIGPDLARVGGKYPHLWHVRHMADPRAIAPQSIMPAYAWLLADDIDFGVVQQRVDAMAMLGVPYGNAVLTAEKDARDQAQVVAREIEEQNGPKGLGEKQIVALIAYLQRLGADIRAPQPSATTAKADTQGVSK
ncbi:MAG TPA: cytochrome-c oxidase, cbb3-type subunit II, partial [Myxococcota bacterium]|nr:cytochrome-c oxidase, cbb3-type subunit II [Myxococcota bacterium]